MQRQHELLTLRGGGCDGGSIPKRIELVKTKQKKEKVDPGQALLQTWFFCQHSKAPLKEPVCADALGKLYNLSSILEYLLRKKGEHPHITSRSDVTILNLTESTENNDPVLKKFICPVTQKEMNGYVKFVYLPCGCTMSQESLNAIDSDKCLVCNKEFRKQDSILLNPSTDSEIEEAKARVSEKMALKTAAKLAKKQKKLAEKGAATVESNSVARKKQKVEDKPAPYINLTLPNLDSIDVKIKESSTPAIKSMYYKKDKDGQAIGNNNNWLSRSTFNRYSAC